MGFAITTDSRVWELMKETLTLLRSTEEES
jgi:hypothetical protein